jgi:hypothetical protein
VVTRLIQKSTCSAKNLVFFEDRDAPPMDEIDHRSVLFLHVWLGGTFYSYYSTCGLSSPMGHEQERDSAVLLRAAEMLDPWHCHSAMPPISSASFQNSQLQVQVPYRYRTGTSITDIRTSQVLVTPLQLNIDLLHTARVQAEEKAVLGTLQL